MSCFAHCSRYLPTPGPRRRPGTFHHQQSDSLWESDNAESLTSLFGALVLTALCALGSLVMMQLLALAVRAVAGRAAWAMVAACRVAARLVWAMPAVCWGGAEASGTTVLPATAVVALLFAANVFDWLASASGISSGTRDVVVTNNHAAMRVSRAFSRVAVVVLRTALPVLRQTVPALHHAVRGRPRVMMACALAALCGVQVAVLVCVTPIEFVL